MIKAKGLRMLFSILIVLGMLLPAVPAQAQGGPVEDRAGGPKKGVELTLRADGAPTPGGTARLTLEAVPLMDAPEMEIKWVLPQGVELIGSEVDTYPSVITNQPFTSERTLRFPAEGTYKIAVSVRLIMSPWSSYGTAGVLFFVIDSQGSRVTDMDPDAHHPSRHPEPGEVTVSVSPLSTLPSSPSDDPCFMIFVHVDRLERPVDQGGYGADIRVPLAGIGVEVRESDLVFDDSYGTLGTDDNGNMLGTFCDDDGLFDDELEIYMRITAERGDPIVYVEDSSYIDEKYEYDTDPVSSSGGDVSFNINFGYNWSAIFNIVDAAWQAREFWVLSGGSYSEETEIHWEPGYGDDGSYYDSYYNEITIADNPSDPDEWEESAIMHEWGHSADDYYSCDDAPGGDHMWMQNIDSEMAWGEGYPDYYQSVVRKYFGYVDYDYYVSIDGGGGSTAKNMEQAFCPTTTENECAIAATLWDLYDVEGNMEWEDRVGTGHVSIQSLYTSDEFTDEAYGVFDDTCDLQTYMHAWSGSGLPADRETAAVVEFNTGYSIWSSLEGVQTTGGNIALGEYTPADVFRWWKQLTYVGDNSHSMTGSKFNAMKVLFTEAVNDFGNDPEGTEFTLELFNNTTGNSDNDVAFAGKFFPEDLIPAINDLVTIPDADPNCEVKALRALAQAIDDKEDGDVWLFTDGDTSQSPSVETVSQLLNENELRASVALMGICAKGEETSLLEPVSTEMLQDLSPAEQQDLMSSRLSVGQARAELGLMADDVPGGLVPYLLTALNSGGQFLYVSPSQVDYAADILRAQITNSAGAGRWSDYVSNTATYRYDTLASWEYDWIDARNGTNRGNPLPNLKLDVPIPGTFQYYSGPYFNTIHVFEDGYVTLGSHVAYVSTNTTLPNPAEPNSALYPYWDNIRPYCPPAGNSGDACVGYIYTLQDGDWYALEFYQYEIGISGILNTFEILFNLDTGEIRYQYQTVPNGAGSATIGLENGSGTEGIQISYNDANGADDGMGYKFVPAPPQPTKTYTVAVDSTMQSVGFLLTGYSGSFEPLAVTDPNGNLISCSSPGTLCLDLDLVQYVQVNTNGRYGDWLAVVDAGPTGSGTFSFTSFAASPIAVEGQTNHTLSTGTQQILVNLSGQVDGCSATGRFQKPDGSLVGYNFSLFDDGTHNDGEACDGLYGSASFYLAPVSAYLTVKGFHRGEAFTRVDPVPYTFQPFSLLSMGDEANFGGVTQLQFQLKNNSLVNHCYWISYSAPTGWWIEFPFMPLECVDAGQTEIHTYEVYMTSGYTNNLPSGTTGIITISATEWEKGVISDSASARITRNRQPYRMEIFNPTHSLRPEPSGDQAVLEFSVTDIQGVAVADGTEVQLITNNGDIVPVFAETKDGTFLATFTSGPNLSPALIMAQTSNGVTASTTIDISNPLPDEIRLGITTDRLPADGTSTATLVATVRDAWGNPVANQQVQIGVEGDAQHGTIDGGEVATGFTNASGQFIATFTAGDIPGKIGVRAELLIYVGGQPVVVDHDREWMYIGWNFLHLPIIRR